MVIIASVNGGCLYCRHQVIIRTNADSKSIDAKMYRCQKNAESKSSLFVNLNMLILKAGPGSLLLTQGIYQVPEYLLALTDFFSQLSFPPPECDQGWPTHGIPLRRRKGRIVSFLQAELCSQFNFNIIYNIITWLRGFLARNCSGCPWRRDV